MEYYNENGFLEEVLLSWDTSTTLVPMEMTDFYNFESSNSVDIPLACASTTITTTASNSFEDYSYDLPFDHSLINSSFYSPFGDELSPPDLTDNTSSFPNSHEDFNSLLEDEVGNCSFQNLEMGNNVPCKLEQIQVSEAPCFNIGLCPERKTKSKKLDGQPSKNLMAERRRRKRLNDRLSMLRSVVPKISKMDRTSILGDTIDYMKELVERINNLQEEMDLGPNQLSLLSIFKDVKPNEMLVRNSPKFDVERRGVDTKVEICCAGKPGLLLSTVTTLEALGLDIQQCVISSFSDFSMQASCSEEMEQRGLVNSEDIKQALFRNAGYGGRCL
ncbi:PREDICTED: transcription factor bHLH93-like [Nicotiana attenuata]|uniref:Transcription factor bhlh93 n=1 Tax=Nicotiana attenuata TaxID=49451 RepID=A0A1J6IM25_NICAT|nr:PREDICTED: transcription factor bHLH93-like [Nicotiana attenuata]OIS96208.1 transcription factor bhlh93 [Nicotiana attenuata]